ncbi:MAG: type IV secretory system conjugative DNA transfer family protein [Lachnospiraceae bacterium]|nr:type IV secretory system conjugative DNA transfer family protein [Lachnospiraceae bacterium]
MSKLNCDFSCLGENYIVPASFELTKLNLNEIIVGATGCGKTFSFGYPRLLHTNYSSIVVPIAKKTLKVKFAKLFKARGYEVIDLDFTNPQNNEYGYNPFDYVKTEEDMRMLADTIVYNGDKDKSRSDPYWDNAAISMLMAEIKYLFINAEIDGTKPKFSDLLNMQRGMCLMEYKELERSIKEGYADMVFADRVRNLGHRRISDSQIVAALERQNKETATNVDIKFIELECILPGNDASTAWKQINALPPRTLGCVISMATSAIERFYTENIVRLCEKKKHISFESIGRRKTAFFITTSPVNKALQSYINLMYSQLFKVLFEDAQNSPDEKLNIPVHIICDDFACGGTIKDFDDYISIFRAVGISVSLYLQSETQLATMYGEKEATTIINNCDTYVFMGSMDIETCKRIAERLDKPLTTVLDMPAGKVAIFRRGSKPVITNRYPTLEDPLYKKLIANRIAEDENTEKEAM